jgi:hypothetical protein
LIEEIDTVNDWVSQFCRFRWLPMKWSFWENTVWSQVTCYFLPVLVHSA